LIAERQSDAAIVDSLRAELTTELAKYATENDIEIPSRLYYVTAGPGKP
jgi:hypothetical protein